MNTISKQELDPSLTTVALLFDKGEWETMSRDLSVEYMHSLTNACLRKAKSEGKTFNGLDSVLLVTDYMENVDALVGVITLK